MEADESRAERARSERMCVAPQLNDDGLCVGLYVVHSQSGNQYVVDIDRSHGCTCPDTIHNRESLCKHRRRVAMSITETDCPAPDQAVGDYQEVFRSLDG